VNLRRHTKENGKIDKPDWNVSSSNSNDSPTNGDMRVEMKDKEHLRCFGGEWAVIWKDFREVEVERALERRMSDASYQESGDRQLLTLASATTAGS
jgi:hypothetical protein